ncbi:MAG: GAF domain-containing protein [Candidatus Rokuibacteriota bacterium]
MSVVTHQHGDILVVDDDPGILETLEDVLSRDGHRVHLAAQGARALERLVQSPPVDVAIVDFKLPDITSLELLNRLKVVSPDTEVILTTGYASLATALDAINGQAVAYLVKPLDPDHVLKTVEQALSRQGLVRALRESEERYRLVTDALAEAVLLLDPTGHLVLANRYAETLTGYSHSDLRDRPLVRLLTPDGAERAMGRLELARRGEEVPPLECELLRRDGTRVWIEANLSRVEKARRLVGYLTVVRDIGDRRRGARTTRAMAQVGRELVASLDVGAAAERIVSAVVEVFQGRRAVLYEIDDASLVCVAAGGPEDCRSWVGWRLPSGAGIAWRALAEDRIVTSAEIPESALPLDADPRLIEEETESTVALPLRARGQLLGVLVLGGGAHRVFGEAEIELLTVFGAQAALILQNAHLFGKSERRRRVAERLSEIANLLPQSLAVEEVGQRIADAVFAVLDVRVAAVFGLDRASGDLVVVALSGNTGPSLRPGVVFPDAAGMVGLAVRERQPVLTPNILTDPRVVLTPELRAAIENAQYHAVLAVPLLVQDRVVGALGIGDLVGRSFGAEDIEIVRAFADQAAIALENHQLYGDLREALAVAGASQEQLVATERLQAVGTLAAGVTHYVNNVLQAVLGSTQLLLRETAEPRVQKRLETLERTIIDAADIMRRVRSFTEATTLSNATPLDLNQLVRDLLDTSGAPWAPLVSAGTIEVTLEPGEIPQVLALPSSLREVLVALILNAVEALSGQGRVRLSTWATLEAVYCAVADSGRGLSDEVRHRALEPFFTTKGPRHQGLGLSLAYGIIRRHSGELEILKDKGQGGTVVFHLPIHRHDNRRL